MARTLAEIQREIQQEVGCLRSITEDALDILANLDQLIRDEAVAAAVAAECATKTQAALIPVLSDRRLIEAAGSQK